ncbi:hypothetical protein [Lentzea sp. NPDC059081]|uniref:hypothetical protein n=1 Tax=Lentzea sp. NPDC059081 TaxID=3346719 RepID=UPI0036922D87
MSDAPDWKPSPKVMGGGVAGAVTTIVLWLVDDLTPLTPPAAVAGAIGVLVTVGVAYLLPGAAAASPVDERPLTDDERQQVSEVVDWFAARPRKKEGN